MGRDDAGQSPESDEDTHIIRRAPLSPTTPPLSASPDPPTGIIRRHPTGEIPTALSEPPTTSVPGPLVRDAVARGELVTVGPPFSGGADPKAAIITAVISILSGWATAVIATDLITGWWGTDLLFCVAVGFLAAISAASTIGGVIALLLRRRIGRILV
ncbi:MAG: hypothetical protein K0U78_09895, partial [Actinomycetia bacterium]|nr:hypothetical protein [Actinomycetes bacterium]